MRVNLLGPLEVYACDQGTNSAPTAQKVRQTLAVLTLHANRSVRTSQLVEELWEDRPPASAGTALQTYVYQIRKRFELGSPRGGSAPRGEETPTLSTIDGGYHLALPEDRVDAFRFEPLVRRARARFQTGDFPRARDLLTSAMSLWRDSALVDVRKGSLLEAEALRLNELYCNARDLRIATDLTMGRHHEILSELTSLAQREPTNEGAQRNLMLALYRADRRADALRVYQRARMSIADELGLDPSPELVALHTAILNCDDSLTPVGEPRTTASPSTGTTVQAPCHLPTPQTRLVGRQGQLVRLTGALTSRTAGRTVVVVSGPVASGKSELSLHAAQQVRAHYPDGQLFGRLLDDDHRPVDPGGLLRSFLRGLGATDGQLPREVTDLSLMFRSWTTDRRVLVVLDDVTSAEDLAPLLPAGRESAALVSARRRLFVPSCAEEVELDRLPLDDGLQVLGSAVADHRITMEPDGMRRLVERCRGVPGALFAVASKLRRRPHWTARQAMAWITRSSEAYEDPLGLRARLDRTLVTLPADTRAAFDTLAAAGDLAPLTPDSAATLLGTGEHRAETLLEELVEVHLLHVSRTSPEDHFHYVWDPAVETLRAPRASWEAPTSALAPFLAA